MADITVTQCEKKGEKLKDGKMVPFYTITLSDGTVAESWAKEIPPGTKSDSFELSDTPYGKKIRLKSSGGGSGGKQRGSNASFALSYSKDIWQSMIAAGAKKEDFDSKQCFMLAEAFYKWLEERK